MSQSGSSDSLWLFSLPLKHREIHEQRHEVIFQDRQILFAYLREKLVTNGDVCYLFPTDLPEFKVKMKMTSLCYIYLMI
jgi:hypothetical protein